MGAWPRGRGRWAPPHPVGREGSLPGLLTPPTYSVSVRLSSNACPPPPRPASASPSPSVTLPSPVCLAPSSVCGFVPSPLSCLLGAPRAQGRRQEKPRSWPGGGRGLDVGWSLREPGGPQGGQGCQGSCPSEVLPAASQHTLCSPRSHGPTPRRQRASPCGRREGAFSAAGAHAGPTHVQSGPCALCGSFGQFVQ